MPPRRRKARPPTSDTADDNTKGAAKIMRNLPPSSPPESEEPMNCPDAEEEEDVTRMKKGSSKVILAIRAIRSVLDDQVLALNSPNGSLLSAAYFDPDDRKIYVLEETKDTWGWDLASLLLEQVHPDKVILSSRCPEALIVKVEEWCGEQTAIAEDMFVIQPHKSFALNFATFALAALRFPDQPNFRQWLESDTAKGSDDTTIEYVQHDEDDAGMGKVRMALVRLGCRVNLDSPSTVCVAGALVHFIRRSSPKQDGQHLEITGMEAMSLHQHMLINRDALASLAILDTESHAFMHNNAEKLSFTLFGLLNTCVTALGKKLMHTWHLRPLTNIDEISARHDSIDMLNYPDNQYSVDSVRRALKQVANVGFLLAKIRRSNVTWRDWAKLLDALVAILDIKDKVNEIGEGVPLPIVAQMIEIDQAVNSDIHLFLEFVSQIVDFDQSKSQDRICVRPGVDDELDHWRHDYASLDGVLMNVTVAVLRPVMAQYQLGTDVNAVYFPQLGHLAVLTGRNMGHSIPAHLEWELRFHTDGMMYYKTPEMRRLDEHYGDIHAKIVDRESAYTDRIAEAAKQVEQVLLGAVGAIAELDCLLALANAARQYGLVKPLMTEEPILEIKEGRHLLHEQLTDNYVSNDTALQGGEQEDGDGLRSMMVITGANGSGKSAYGKQVALITFMAQIGSFVPATNATIGIVDKIYTRVQTRESSSKPASAFMIDLAQVSLALRGATSRSLIILDEFGKGTTPADGAGLLTGVLEYLIQNNKPRTIVMTHFHELFTNSLLDPDWPILLAHMKTISPPDLGDQVTFLYKSVDAFTGGYAVMLKFRLSPTVCMTSNAAECALLHGIPPDVVERGRYVTECITKFELSKIFDCSVTAEQAADLRRAEAVVEAFLSWDLSQDTVDVALQLRELLDGVRMKLEPEGEDRRSPSESPDRPRRGDDADQPIRIDISEDGESEVERSIASD